jgi:CysZ protein
MKGDFLKGVFFFLRGIKLVFSPGLRRYIIVPILVNVFIFVLVFASIAWYIMRHLPTWLTTYSDSLLMLLGGVFWFLYGILALLIGSFTFTLATNFIASPFYGLLASAVEKRYSSNRVSSPFSLRRTLLREISKILYFLPWALFCMILFIFPPLWTVIPILMFLLLSCFLAVQYIDYCADNQHITLRTLIDSLKSSPLTTLGFGTAVSVMMLLPAANLFVPPIAVAGGTVLWLHLKGK